MVDALGFSLHRLDSAAFARFESAYLAEGIEASNSRDLLLSPAVRALAVSPALRWLVEPVLGLGAFPVCARLFNKNPDTNWLVPWHKDLTIRVRERREVAGYGPWSRKDGVDHVQPPVAVLENMLAVRIHLDPADSSNGGLGRISADRVDELALSLVPKPCDANRGDLLPVRRVNRIVVMLSEDL